MTIRWSAFGKDNPSRQASYTLDRLVAMPEHGLVQELAVTE